MNMSARAKYSLLLADCWNLTKPRVIGMVLVTTVTGFLVANGGFQWSDGWKLLLTLLGTGLAGGGSTALNNYLERDLDALMKRTQMRALAAGRLDPSVALSLGILLVVSGVALLAFAINLLSAFLVLLTAFIYVLIYTPLKRITWLNTSIGAITGALPIMVGWTAVRNDVAAGSWVLFGILYLWQHPHVFAVTWMYREDYSRAGYKMLSVIDPTGRRAFHQAILFSLALIPVSIALTALGLAGMIYLIGAILLGAALLTVSLTLAQYRTIEAARRVLYMSLIYLPLLLLLIILDAGVLR
ncbi:MAG: heme o synthase [Verrucomicrobia bacterium]|nr:heme o synthase [Kiritimatiellia bacterium]MCO6399861.1 heme o synthase [Verrucomicrobiota bacterium]